MLHPAGDAGDYYPFMMLSGESTEADGTRSEGVVDSGDFTVIFSTEDGILKDGAERHHQVKVEPAVEVRCRE